MFERTRSFWRRLLARATPGQGPLGMEERRVWIRYRADLQTSYKPASAPETTRLSTHVRNISLGGINLVGSRPFQPGELLTVELPGSTEQSRYDVLACVVHCTEERPGECSLGCNFSRELTDDDLASFGAKREKSEPPDQRQWRRFAARVTAIYQPVAQDNKDRLTAQVLDISPSGLRLLVEREMENGTLLSVELHNGAGTRGPTMLACIVHVNCLGDKGWVLGCNFIRSLNEQDLEALV
jgi:c-di-GMP-binding flagellar brake protein YcgR